MKRHTFVSAGTTFVASLAMTRTRARAAAIQLKCGSDAPTGDPMASNGAALWHRVRAATNGGVDVQFFPNGLLGGDPAMLSQVRSGALDFMLCPGGIAALVVPVAGIENTAYAFKNARDAAAALDGPLGAAIRAEIERAGLVVFPAAWDGGMRHITTSARPIHGPDDLTGLKIRTPSSRSFVELFRALGALPTTVNLPETFVALQTHVVDGAENALSVVEYYKFFEAQRYLSLTGHAWAGFWLIANPESWKRLDDAQRRIVARLAREAALAQRRDNEVLTASLVEKLARQGLTANTVDARAFRPRLREYYASMRALFGDRAFALLEAHTGPLAVS